MSRTENGSRFRLFFALIFAFSATGAVCGAVGCGGPGPVDPSDTPARPIDDDTAIGLGQGGGGSEEEVEPASEDVEVPPAP